MRLHIVACMFIFFALQARSINAQNFEADSVRYTPIPKTPSKERKLPLKLFQDTTRNGKLIEYFFSVNAGAITGCDYCIGGDEVTFTASTIHGVTIGRKLRAGAGIGIDSYTLWQTMPMFGNISFDLLGSKNIYALFIQGQYGWAYGWYNPQDYDWSLVDAGGGKMFATQAGFRIKYHKMNVALLMGPKYQTVSLYHEYPTWFVDETGITRPGKPSTLTVIRNFKTFSISLSVGWN